MYLMVVDVTLTPQEQKTAQRIGALRNKEAIRMGLKDKHGLEHGSKSGLDCHVEGVGGELACARVLLGDHHNWTPLVNTFHAADMGENIQVKTRGRHSYDLLVRPADRDDDVFVLVTHAPENIIDYRVHGFIWGNQAKHPDFLKEHGGRPKAYFVPQNRLVPIEALIS